LDHAAERRIGRRELLPTDGRGRAGRARRAGDLLGIHPQSRQGQGRRAPRRDVESAAGRCFPLMVVVALGEPGVPVICWAYTTRAVRLRSAAPSSAIFTYRGVSILMLLSAPFESARCNR